MRANRHVKAPSAVFKGFQVGISLQIVGVYEGFDRWVQYARGGDDDRHSLSPRDGDVEARPVVQEV